MSALEDAPFVDVFSDEFRADPGAILDPLRSGTGVIRTPVGASVIRRDLVQSLFSDRRLRNSVADIVHMQGVTDGVIHDLVTNSLLATDGPQHARIRRMVNRAFTPRAVDPHRQVIRDILGALLDPLAGRGSCEFMAEVADHYPIQVMCALLGVPDDDHEDFATWNKAMTWVLSFELTTHLEEAAWGAQQLDAYVGRLIDERRENPRDDMVTALAQVEDGGDCLTDLELRSLIAGLLFAGFDTTRNQLGLAMALFADHPDQWALLVERPELAPSAVEEVMRFGGAVTVAPRVTVEDVVIDGCLVPAGTMVALATGAANFDPAVYLAAYELDITAIREPHLTFGGGPHYCLGANLARAEMQEALTLLAERMPTFALDGEPTWRSPFGIFGPETLPLRFAAEPAEAQVSAPA